MIPVILIDQIARRAECSFVSEMPWDNPGYLTLYDKNTNRNHRFANPRPLDHLFAYVAECDAIPPYFARVIRPFSAPRHSPQSIPSTENQSIVEDAPDA